MSEVKRVTAFIFRIPYDIIAEETPHRDALNRALALAGVDRYVAGRLPAPSSCARSTDWGPSASAASWH